ncbi:hypothetical protein K440DRAFT_637762 [Wilcoxina mikolae CBS 423.85]|nr:hypothetical protein K440DRAFT_637762 [Wilcoxina mikolae CBS 423.85]
MTGIEHDKAPDLGAAITANKGKRLPKFLLEIIDRNVQVSIEKYRENPTSKVGDLLGLDEGQSKRLWGLDLSSVRELKGVYEQRKRESSGKSVQVKSVLGRHLKTVVKPKELGSREILYYFCNNRRRGTKERADSILRALLHQLLTRKPYILDSIFESDAVLDSSSFQSDSWEWSTQRLWGIFSTATRNSGLQELVMIIDALDECERDSAQIFCRYFQVGNF